MSEQRPSEAEDAERKTQPAALENLVPLAAVIGAGCEPCAETMVTRALEREEARPSVERALAILAGVAAAKCFAEAIGPEALDRMKRSLRAGQKALHASPTGHKTCCG